MEVKASAEELKAGWKRGQGSPLVLVHGTAADHDSWGDLLPLLEAHHIVYSVSRRGRGAVISTGEYSIADDAADVASICDSTGAPTALLGHGYGGLIAMEAALRTDNISRLIIYEPWLVPMRVLRFGVVDNITRLIGAGQNEAALLAFFRDVVRAPDAELAAHRVALAGPERITLIPSMMNELGALGRYRFDGLRFRNLKVPTLLLYGSASGPSAGRQAWIAHEALRNSLVRALPGQAHLAMDTAPDLFAQAILDFVAQ